MERASWDAKLTAFETMAEAAGRARDEANAAAAAARNEVKTQARRLQAAQAAQAAAEKGGAAALRELKSCAAAALEARRAQGAQEELVQHAVEAAQQEKWDAAHAAEDEAEVQRAMAHVEKRRREA